MLFVVAALTGPAVAEAAEPVGAEVGCASPGTGIRVALAEPTAGAAIPAATLAPVALVVPPVAETAVQADTDAKAESEGGVSYGAEIDMNSRYLWRGLALSHGAVLQPSVHLSAHGATITAWNNTFLGSEPDLTNRFGELDLIAEYQESLGKLTITPSFIAYIYPQGSPTGELGAGVGYDLSVLKVSTHQFVDVIDNAGGYYADVGLSRAQPLGAKITLDGATVLGWCSGRFTRFYLARDMRGLGLGAASADLGVKFAATAAFSARLHGTYSRMLDTGVRAEVGPDAQIFLAGVSAVIEL